MIYYDSMTKLVKFKPAPGYALLETSKEQESKGLSLQVKVSNLAKVIAIGQPVHGEYNGIIYKPNCKVGDMVYHTSTGYEDINIDGKVFRVIKFQNILGTL